MHQVQEKLEFNIDKPSDKDLAERFASRQGEISKRLTVPNTSRNYQKRQRKNAKKRAHQHA